MAIWGITRRPGFESGKPSRKLPAYPYLPETGAADRSYRQTPAFILAKSTAYEQFLPVLFAEGTGHSKLIF